MNFQIYPNKLKSWYFHLRESSRESTVISRSIFTNIDRLTTDRFPGLWRGGNANFSTCFGIHLFLTILTLVFTSCTNCSCPCPCGSNDGMMTHAETYPEPQEAQVVQEVEKILEVQVAQETKDIQELQVASCENPQTALVIKRASADLSGQLSLLTESGQQKVTLLPSAKQKSLESEQALLTPTAAERTTKSVRA